jgi:AcrR family transcriptional regulator
VARAPRPPGPPGRLRYRPPMPSEPGDPDPRVSRTRDAVRRAVRTLVQRDGVEALTHQQVATEAGVGRATVYRHWPDRTHLLLEALADVETPTTWRSSGDLATDLATELHRLQHILTSSPMVPELVALISRAEWEPELREIKAKLLATGTAGLRATLRAATARGELPGDLDLDAEIARLAGPLFYRRVLAHAPIEDTFVERLLTAFLGETRPAG